MFFIEFHKNLIARSHECRVGACPHRALMALRVFFDCHIATSFVEFPVQWRFLPGAGMPAPYAPLSRWSLAPDICQNMQPPVKKGLRP